MEHLLEQLRSQHLIARAVGIGIALAKTFRLQCRDTTDEQTSRLPTEVRPQPCGKCPVGASASVWWLQKVWKPSKGGHLGHVRRDTCLGARGYQHTTLRPPRCVSAGPVVVRLAEMAIERERQHTTLS